MRMRNFFDLFTRWDRDSADKMPGWIWVTGSEEAALVDPISGRMLAYIEGDGYGKFYPILSVSIIRMFRVLHRTTARPISLRYFPRITVELFRLKTSQINEAQGSVEAILFG